ncbi:3-dehydroquinate dehydratase [Candidatus Carsonella ruddii PV]|uniref:3-dehydroquinate dehydratase n=2 Tax=Carsonella ruddii TaxID=114186 RepID=Q9AHW6_CARRU|nr:type II 3-dehydroquinate dehydratase [Candidatus Carsonella ruddii]AAK17115.1 3-dehydroquinate dehydratase [Candidatus Carsonella ruddii]BAF35043.1 3-dehydroquinate dehydratase [Candidatus Carsonella ruddii PV]
MFVCNKIINVLIINGPNINFLKKREKIYSKISFKKLKKKILKYSKNIINIKFYNSNCEGKIINFIQKNINFNYIIINPGAYSHYSIALLDCIKIFKGKIIELHISNIYNREYYRKNSIISLNSNVVISGMKENGYFHAINYILSL